jgi:large subunit ribosomal protein L25
MIQTNLKVKLRTERGKKSIVRNLRADGYVPGICYGALKESVLIYVSAKELKAALSTEAKEHVLIKLNADKGSELNAKTAILKDIVRHPLKRTYIHADFQILDMKKPIKVNVGVKLLGKAAGVAMGGILDQVRREVEVKCLPTNIPAHLDLDISALEIGDSLHVRDIEAIEGVEILTSGDLTIAVIAAAIVIEEPVAAEEEELEEAAEEEEEGKGKEKEASEE